MKFGSMDELKMWLSINDIYNFDGGSQGECYKIGDKVYKILLQYIDDDYGYCCNFSEYSKDDILRFSSIKNNTYIWPIDVIVVNDIVVGYIMNYINAKSLSKINPLAISLDKFEQNLDKVRDDVRIISNNGVLTYDVWYNIMYGRNGFKVIDTLEYSSSNDDREKLFVHNSNNFAYEVKLFLVDGYFDAVINDNKLLKEMYNEKGVNILDFLKLFRSRLCEIEDKEILKLGDAKKSIYSKQKRAPRYIRDKYIK